MKMKMKINVFLRYFPRSSSRVHPKLPVKDSASVVPSLEAELECKARQLHDLSCRVAELEAEKHKFVEQQERLKAGFDKRVAELTVEIQQLNQSSCNSDVNNNNNNNKLSGVKSLGSFRKTSSFSCGIMKENVAPQSSFSCGNLAPQSIVSSINEHNAVKLDENLAETTDIRVPRVPKPPPKRCFSAEGPKLTNPVSGPPLPPPPPPPSALNSRPPLAAIPPPPPPPLPGGVKLVTAKVKRMPEVVEFYHSVVRRDSRQDSVVGVAETTLKANARDLVGEIEKRSVYLHAIKKDVEIQGEFIRFLIKEVETAAFTDIRDMVSFVKWLDEELSYLVDERAVLKHFDWPEQKADALREAAFEYSDLRKLETEASSFRHDTRQACSTTLKKMQALLEKLEQGVFNLSRLRESATNRFKSFHIPVDWMLEIGFVSQIKLASVKLAMKYMKRVSAELETVDGGPEGEELIVQGVRFAFRVHQFAGGFNVETMTAFKELRDKAGSYQVQCQNQLRQRLACRSMPH